MISLEWISSSVQNYGGGGGNRTRVQRYFNRNFYVRRLSFRSRSPRLRQPGSWGRQPEKESSEPPQAEGLGLAHLIDARFRPNGRNRRDVTALRRPLHTNNRLQLNYVPNGFTRYRDLGTPFRSLLSLSKPIAPTWRSKIRNLHKYNNSLLFCQAFNRCSISF